MRLFAQKSKISGRAADCGLTNPVAPDDVSKDARQIGDLAEENTLSDEVPANDNSRKDSPEKPEDQDDAQKDDTSRNKLAFRRKSDGAFDFSAIGPWAIVGVIILGALITAIIVMILSNFPVLVGNFFSGLLDRLSGNTN